MSLYEQWIKQAYTPQGQTNSKVWKLYLPGEQKIYENLLENKIADFSFKVSELAEKYNMPVHYICGFADGIKEALDNEIDVEGLEPDSELTLKINFEKLYKKMIEYKADHLHILPVWETIFDAETLGRFRHEVATARIFVRETEKIGRNDLCPCGSGKKYKKCCGA